jgi:alanine racemase
VPATTAGPALALRAEVLVDLDAIRTSVSTLQRHAGDAAVMAVVKADGYGHGAVPSARAALDGGATWLGTVLVEEALALRAAGITARVLVLMEPPPGAAELAVGADVELGIGSVDGLLAAAHAGLAAGRPVHVHLKVDTGLSRGGATGADWPALVAAAAREEAEGGVRVVGVWSHFAHADDPGHPTTATQLARFRDALDVATRGGLRPEVRHIANSAATLTLPDAAFDLVRPGIAVYGISPVPATASSAQLQLAPAMTLRARVALTKRVPAATGVSYGHRYTTSSDATLALVPLGYADGVPRAATNTAEVWLAGARRRISGTVCMDQFLVDVGDDPVETGDEVLLFGPGTHGEPTAQDWARALDTISYEIITRVGTRVPRTYLGEGA